MFTFRKTVYAMTFLVFWVIDPVSCYAQNPAGVWRGEWHSGSTGHHGPMRASIQPRSDGAYQARFVGRFAIVVPFAYRVTMYPQVNEYGNSVLVAEKPLGRLLGGTYRMNAQAMGDQLLGGFQAAGDNGTISMQRVR